MKLKTAVSGVGMNDSDATPFAAPLTNSRGSCILRLLS